MVMMMKDGVFKINECNIPLLRCQEVSFVDENHIYFLFVDFFDVLFKIFAAEQKWISGIDDLNNDIARKRKRVTENLLISIHQLQSKH